MLSASRAGGICLCQWQTDLLENSCIPNSGLQAEKTKVVHCSFSPFVICSHSIYTVKSLFVAGATIRKYGKCADIQKY